MNLRAFLTSIWPCNDSQVTYIQLRHLKLQGQRKRVSKEGTRWRATVSKELAAGRCNTVLTDRCYGHVDTPSGKSDRDSFSDRRWSKDFPYFDLKYSLVYNKLRIFVHRFFTAYKYWCNKMLMVKFVFSHVWRYPFFNAFRVYRFFFPSFYFPFWSPSGRRKLYFRCKKVQNDKTKMHLVKDR